MSMETMRKRSAYLPPSAILGEHAADTTARPVDHPAGAARWRRWFAGRFDPVHWAIGALSALLSTCFILVSLSYNGWAFIPPLDDVYIHLQYAQQFGTGHPFEYNTGDPVSKGASSLLYMVVLGGFAAFGVHGHALLITAMIFGAVCMALTAVCVCAIGGRLVNRTVGIWAGLLVATNGALVWGGVSGMEVGFVALLLAATTLAVVAEAPRGRFVLAPVLGFFTSLARPEAFIFVVVLTIAMAWITLRHGRGDATRPRRFARSALLPLPFFAYGGQSLFYLVATGSSSANGMRAKSLLHEPIFYPTEFAGAALSHFNEFVRVFTGLEGFDYVIPAAPIAALAGVIWFARRQSDRFPIALALFGGFLLVLLAISTMRTPTMHHLRYVQPFLPMLVLLTAVGLYALASALGSQRGRGRAGAFVLSGALLFTLIQIPAWGIRLGQQAAGIRDQQVSITAWTDQHLPEDAVVAVNDVGAPAFLGEHRIVDLIGLTTNKLTVPSTHGPGSLYEALRDMPKDRRPDYFVVFPSWSVHDLVHGGVFGDEPLATFRLDSPTYSRIAPGGGSICQAARYCDVVHIHRADWDAAEADTTPVEAVRAGTVRDHVNVADLDDEHEHGYRVDPAHTGFQPTTDLDTERTRRGEIVDSGRKVLGGEIMTVRRLTPGLPLTITGRIEAVDNEIAPHGIDVYVDGRHVGLWHREEGRAGWTESTFTVPARFLTDNSARIRLGSPDELLSPLPDYVSYGYWFSQKHPADSGDRGGPTTTAEAAPKQAGSAHGTTRTN
ncbi:4-amino-4-deoxy-L-arabinose transferase-like glycosyltransferase [Halopolyspora algeriensis]|uniref:4-amino-4-deoxy-L-arabinose transferase-like glycosyltransferase n=1 Tax=Halopolyspora algeriensis TaxID=1500506 RepID=A0A368VEQ4_9ACTN|nr:hypothetical protein [Halopolyspora algeriensis]RCW39747.1 4-amino-4-deoxy-L-arabinose transferase-like glycosyltransferase [Halopolyspora algeriensis]TQM56402.1 4-amino-4-deoxy-L-arabinose transferase-like glycosyltransferase [Halopolyspora algeriensis]